MTCAAPLTLIPTVSFVRVTFVVVFFGVCHRVSRFSKLIPTGDRPLSLEEIQVHPYFNLHKIQCAPVAFYLGRWHNFEVPTLIANTKGRRQDNTEVPNHLHSLPMSPLMCCHTV